jgi:superfamily II DNA helicase RecQ
VWNVPELRPLQMQAIKHVLMPSTPNTLFLIDRTGGGKSHVIRTLGAILKGIIIVFIPILSLSADLLEKFRTASQRFGSVHAHHVDEIIDASPDKRSELLIRINSMQRETTSTLFLFLSPQLMIHHTDFRDALIRQCRAGVVRLVTIDEAHLYVQHGISFRSKIRMMKNIFFNKVFHPTMKIKPAFIAATATMNHPFIAQLTSLTTIKFPPRSIIWPPSFQFRQRSINMVFTTSHEYAKAGLNYVVEFLQENPGRCACVFVNSRFKSHDIVSKLEEKLNHCAIKSDVVHIHGRQFKEEKFHFIRMFCANSHVESYQPDILVATSAANVGIDHHLVDLVVRFGFPR